MRRLIRSRFPHIARTNEVSTPVFARNAKRQIQISAFPELLGPVHMKATSVDTTMQPKPDRTWPCLTAGKAMHEINSSTPTVLTRNKPGEFIFGIRTTCLSNSFNLLRRTTGLSPFPGASTKAN